MKAETVFRAFGQLRPLTDREVPPTPPRTLPTDRSPAAVPDEPDDEGRSTTSVAPPAWDNLRRPWQPSQRTTRSAAPPAAAPAA
jgi:hypothetical protein